MNELGRWTPAMEEDARGAPSARQALHDAWGPMARAQLDLPSLLDTTARSLASIGRGGCSIRLLSDDGTRLVPVAVHHADPKVLASLLRSLGTPEEISVGCWGPLVRERRPVRVLARPGAVPPGMSPWQIELIERYGAIALLGLPLLSRDALLGALIVGRFVDPFDEDEEDAYRDAAQRIALAIDNARLFDDLRREQRRADETQATLEALVASARIGMGLVDGELRLVHVNDQLARMNGQSAEHHVGRTLREVSHPLADTVESLARRVIETGAPVLDAALRVELPPGSGDHRHLRGSYYPVSIGGGPGVGALILDVTDQVRAAEAEAHARAQAVAENRAKDDFLAALSHELRTPLTALLGWLGILRGKTPDPELLARALGIMERNVRTEARLVDDILDVSRIVAGKLRLELCALDLDTTVRAAMELVAPAAEAKVVTLEVVVAPACGAVLGDPTRLQQVIWNLLSNAIKFTPAGGRVRVEVTCAGPRAHLRVSDTGCGITAEFLPHVFERFAQADTSPTLAPGGLGLGLAIAGHLAELHGGSLTASSPGVGLGATFTLTLPTAPTAPTAPERVEGGCDPACVCGGLSAPAPPPPPGSPPHGTPCP